MTKRELINALAKYPDDAEIYLGTRGYDEALTIDAVEETFGAPTIVNNDEVTAYNVQDMAFRYYHQGAGRICTIDEYAAYENWEKLL